MANSGKSVGLVSLAGVVIALGAWFFPDIQDRIWPAQAGPSVTTPSQVNTGRPAGQPTGRQTGARQTGGSEPEWSCPGGTFCVWDGPDATGVMVSQKDSTCRLHDIGSAGQGDRVSSFQNRTGKPVGLYNWTGQKWDLLLRIADGQKGNVPKAADNATDAIKICDE